MKKYNMNVLSGPRSLGKYCINSGISALSLVIIIPDVIIPTLIPQLTVKRKGKKLSFSFDNRKKR